MKEISEFLASYWQYISIGIVIILEVVLIILKRFKVSLNVPHFSYQQIVRLIRNAEDIFGEGLGKEKLNYVIETYMKENSISYIFVSTVQSWVTDIVEDLLSLPTKKGGLGREQVEQKSK